MSAPYTKARLHVTGDLGNASMLASCSLGIDDEFGAEGGRDYFLFTAVHGDPDELAGNARRMVACWNAFHGMDTETVELIDKLGGVERIERSDTGKLIERSGGVSFRMPTMAALSRRVTQLEQELAGFRERCWNVARAAADANESFNLALAEGRFQEFERELYVMAYVSDSMAPDAADAAEARERGEGA